MLNCIVHSIKLKFSAGVDPHLGFQKNITAFRNMVNKKLKYDGRSKKRRWEERRMDQGEAFLGIGSKKTKIEEPLEESTTEEIVAAKADRVKRRKYALLLGYSGNDYFGMQRNPKMKTIEEDLLKALFETKHIPEDCYNQVQNMQFQRAARTDKGVSAARQVVSLKLPENLHLEEINQHLPEVIRIFASKRVTKGFNSKTNCDARTYFYMLPTVAFSPYNLQVKQDEYKVNPKTLDKVNELLNMYVGTKNFHNFTSRKKPNDPSANRYIKSFICEKPFVRSNVEFAVIKVTGQSFMLHQIRKMVGLMLAIVKNQASEEVLTQAFDTEKVNIPRAPGLGLVLDYVHYDRYNSRYGEDGIHEKLIWDEADEAVEAFKEQYIYPTIISTEINELSMVTWLENKLSKHTYDEIDDEDDENGDDESDEKKNEGEHNEIEVRESIEDKNKTKLRDSV